MNAAIDAGGQGIEFAIPINIAKHVVELLKDKGKFVRGWLGVLIHQITSEIAEVMKLKELKGPLVSDITPDRPAEKGLVKRRVNKIYVCTKIL